MMRTLCLVLLVAASCKGETVIKPDPQTQADLDKCKKDKDDLDAYKKKLEAENAQLMQKGSGAEIVVTIEGDLMKVKAPAEGNGGNSGPPVDPKVAEAASKNFQNVVEKSRGAIQKCYEQALKKNAAAQGHTITVTVMASFATSGAYRQASFATSSPLGDAFDGCMQNIASHWTLPQNSPAMTFRAQVSLTPS